MYKPHLRNQNKIINNQNRINLNSEKHLIIYLKIVVIVVMIISKFNRKKIRNNLKIKRRVNKR